VERRAGGIGGDVRAARWAQTYLFVLDGFELAKGRGVVVDGGFAVARWVRRISFRTVDRGTRWNSKHLRFCYRAVQFLDKSLVV
jgi:hypothetical protein